MKYVRTLFVIAFWAGVTWALCTGLEIMTHEKVTNSTGLIIFIVLFHHSILIDRIEGLKDKEADEEETN